MGAPGPLSLIRLTEGAAVRLKSEAKSKGRQEKACVVGGVGVRLGGGAAAREQGKASEDLREEWESHMQACQS